MTQRLCQMKEAESNQLLEGLPLFPDSLPTLSQKQCKQILTPILSGPGRLPYRSSPTSSPSPQLPSATIGTREQQRSKAQEQRKGFIINCSVSTNVNHRTPKGIVTLQKSKLGNGNPDQMPGILYPILALPDFYHCTPCTGSRDPEED